MLRLLCVLGLTMTLCAAAFAQQLDRIRATGRIVIAHREASIPFSYLDGNGKPTGYAVELCQRIAQGIQKELRLPALELEYLAVTPATRLDVIARGQASMECGSTTNTAERRQRVDYTIAHFIASARFMVRASSGIERVEQLAGRTVVSTRGTTNITSLRRLNDEQLLRMRIVEATDHAQAFEMVARQHADAFAMDDVLLYGLRARSAQPHQFAIVGRPFTIEPYAIMLPKADRAFKAMVDAQMRALIYSGELARLYRKWFQEPIAPGGIVLDLPMSAMLRESLRYPSDKVGDLSSN